MLPYDYKANDRHRDDDEILHTDESRKHDGREKRADNGAERNIFRKRHDYEEHREAYEEHLGAAAQKHGRKRQNALAALEIEPHRPHMTDRRGYATQKRAGLTEDKSADKARQRGLSNVAQKREQRGFFAVGTKHIRKTRVSAAGFAQVAAVFALRYDYRGVYAAEQISRSADEYERYDEIRRAGLAEKIE